MKKNILAFVILLGLGSLVVVHTASAGPLSGALTNVGKANQGTGLSGDLTGTVGTIIKAVLATVGTIFLVLTIYAGILWMTASGNEEQIAKSQGIIKAAIIGLFITMSAYAITAFVGGKLNT